MKENFRYVLIAWLLFTVGAVFSQANIDGPLPFSKIREGDPAAVKAFFKDHDVNGYYGENELTPLSYAIQQDQYKMVKLLGRGNANLLL